MENAKRFSSRQYAKKSEDTKLLRGIFSKMSINANVVVTVFLILIVLTFLFMK